MRSFTPPHHSYLINSLGRKKLLAVMVSLALAGSMLNGAYAADVSNQNKVIDDNTLRNLVYGGYTDNGSAINNSVTLNNEARAQEILGGWSISGTANDNRVTLNDSSQAMNDVSGGRADNDVAANNKVILNNSAQVVNGNIYGGLSISSSANHNSVTLNNKTIANRYIYGGSSSSGSANDNSVTLNDNAEVFYDVFGGYTYNGEVYKNRVTLKDEAQVHGNIYGGYSEDGAVSYNKVEINDNVIVSNELYGGKSVSGFANQNRITLNNNVRVYELLYGGRSDYSSANYNRVTLNDMTEVNEGIFGGRSSFGSANDNIVTLNNKTIANRYIYGGNSSSGSANNNSVTLNDEAIVNSGVYGGMSGNVEANNNSVTLNNEAIVNSSVYGGNSSSGSANKNTVTLKDRAKVEKNIYGGYSLYTGSDNNRVNLYGGTVRGAIYAGYSGSGSVTNNSIKVVGSDTLNLEKATLYGSNVSAKDAKSTGNSLTMTGFSGSLKNIVNFNSVSIDLDGTLLSDADNDAVIKLTSSETTDFTGTLLTIYASSGLAHSMNGKLAQRYELISNDNADAGITISDTTLKNKTLTIGKTFSISGLYDIVHSDDHHSIDAVKVKEQVRPGTNIYTQGQLAASGFLNAGTDFALDRKLTCSLNRDGSIPETCVYVDVKGEKLWHQAHSDASLRTQGAHLVVGVKNKLNDHTDTSKDINGALYFEAGTADVKVRNSWAHGNGDSSYYGFGLVTEYRQHAGALQGAYLQAYGHVGKVATDFDAYLFDVAATGSYDESMFYWGYGAEVGYFWPINKDYQVDVVARYRSLTVEGFDSVIRDDTYAVDNIDSQRSHLGLRFNYTGNDNFTPYIGAAWEYEFDSNARGSVSGYSLETDNLKGSTGIGEIGFKLNPTANKAWTLDCSVEGYIGRLEGGAVSIFNSYLF